MQSDFFDSFICNRGDCLDKISDNSYLLNCFHTICRSHVGTADQVFCSDQLCTLMHHDYPNYIALPPQNKRCENIVNNRLASHLLCLYNAKQNGANCGMCAVDNGTLQFCTECPSILCQDHRQEPHCRLGPKHVFVDLTLTAENILIQSARNIKVRTKTCDQIYEHIDNLKMDKESIDFCLVHLNNSFQLVHEKRLKLIEETEASFTQIRRHIEKMREELLEELNSKTESYLRDLEQKRTLLQFQSAAASRAINLARFIQTTGIKVPQKFVDMFSTDSLAFLKQLYEVPQPPIEHTNIPKIIKNTLNMLDEIHTIDPIPVATIPPVHTPSDSHCYYYFNCKGLCYPYTDIISWNDQCRNDTLFVLFTNKGDFTTNIIWGESKMEFFFFKKDSIQHHLHPKDGGCQDKEGKQIEVSLKSGKLQKVEITLKTYKAVDKPSFTLNFEKEKVGLSLFSMTPANLSGLASSNKKLIAINKSGKEILVFDASHEIISKQMDKEETLPFALVTRFVCNDLMEPNSIAAVRALIFVSDCTCHSLFCFTEEGSFIRRFGRFGIHTGEFNRPMGISGDAVNGRLVVADSGNRRVQIFVLSSQKWNCFEVEENLQNTTVPIDVKLDTLGNFYILTESNGIIKYDKNFNFPISILPSGNIIPVMPFFAISRNDVIYLCAEKCGSIYTIKRSGNDTYNFNTYYFTQKKIHPAAITFDEDNKLYITHNKPVEIPNPPTSLVYVVTQKCGDESL